MYQAEGKSQSEVESNLYHYVTKPKLEKDN